MKHEKTFEAINKLREVEIELHRLKNALEMTNRVLEIKDEPVAWGMEKDGIILDVICPDEHEREEGGYTVPLYTTPQRKPLTDEEVYAIGFDLNIGGIQTMKAYQAIEAAHGIKE